MKFNILADFKYMEIIKESEIRNVVAWTFRLNDAERNITVYLTDEEMWFVLRDIYEAVHETEMTEISILHRDECAIVALHNHDGLPKDTLVVNVSGIYSILNYIGTKTASDLGRWISKEVIPKGYHWIKSEDNYVDSVANQRQEDSVITNTTQSDIHDILKDRDRIDSFLSRFYDLCDSVDSILRYHPIPVAALLNDTRSHTIGLLAEHYGIPRQKFLDTLENVAVLFRDGRSYGFTEATYVKEFIGEGGCIEDDGERDYSFRIYLIDPDTTELTYEGIHYIYNKLSSRNIYPQR